MAVVGIEISDVGLMAASGAPARLVRVDGDRSESPGIALQRKKKLLVGWEARRQDRLYPRQATSRFWSLLSMEPLQERALEAENYAELVYAHLAAVAESIRVPEPRFVMAVPEFLDPPKLGIVLGVAQALNIPVDGFVSNAVAAVPFTDEDGPLLHVDVHLHRVEVTLLEQGDRLQRTRSSLVTDLGWERLEDQVAHRIANEFVQTTRFDPLHEAVSEQALYDQVPDLLDKVADGQPIPLELTLGKSAYRIAVPVRMIIEVCQTLCGKVVETLSGFQSDAGGRICLSHRAARVPGLQAAVEAGAREGVRVLAPGAGALGALAMQGEFREDNSVTGVNLLTSKARTGAAPAPPPLPSPSVAPPPTHVLFGDQAYPLRDGPWCVVETGGGRALLPADALGDHKPLGRIQLEEGQAVVQPTDLEVRLIRVHPHRET